MSIEKFSKFVQGPVGRTILLAGAVALAASLFTQSCSTATFQMKDATGKPYEPVVTVNGVQIPRQAIDNIVEEQTKNYPGPVPADQRVMLAGTALGQLIDAGLAFDIAKKNGINIDDKVMMAELLPPETELRKQFRQELVAGGQLKAEATEAEFEAKVKELTRGRTVKDLYSEREKLVQEQVKDNMRKNIMVLAVAPQLVLKKYQKDLIPTDEDLKRSFDDFKVKQIVLQTKPDRDKAATAAKAKELVDQIKSGKSFDDVLNANTDMPLMDQKKKKSDEASTTMPRSAIEAQKDLEPLLTAKVGDIVGPIDSGGIAQIVYKLEEIKPNVPKEFEKEKEQLRKKLADQRAQTKLRKELEEARKSVNPTFDDPGYGLMYKFLKAQTDLQKDPGQNMAIMQKLYDEAKGVEDANGYGKVLAFIAYRSLYNDPKADKAKLKPTYMAEAEKFIAISDQWQLRKEVIEHHIETKNGAKAVALLSEGLDKNMKYDETGQAEYADQASLFGKLKSGGMLTKEQETDLSKKLEVWRNEKKLADKEKAEAAPSTMTAPPTGAKPGRK